jgi:hypothetical protein
MKRNLVVVATLLTLVGSSRLALAHDEWRNGESVPAWVKQQCCGVSDAHHLRTEQVHLTPHGYQLDGYTKVLPENQLMPSPDGSWWVFYRDYPDGTQSGVFCFFGPQQSS